MYKGEDIEVVYVDTEEKGISNYPLIEKIATRGYAFPVLSFNDVPKLAGAINVADVQQVIDEMKKEGQA
ncbi:MAG: hypothetical protein ACM3QZ_12710 [Solirubrobacterales bacterium]